MNTDGTPIIEQPLSRSWQRAVVGLYFIGIVAMVAFNFSCYPGTIVGKVGWALIWPLSAPAYVYEFGMMHPGTLAETCFL